MLDKPHLRAGFRTGQARPLSRAFHNHGPPHTHTHMLSPFIFVYFCSRLVITLIVIIIVGPNDNNNSSMTSSSGNQGSKLTVAAIANATAFQLFATNWKSHTLLPRNYL